MLALVVGGNRLPPTTKASIMNRVYANEEVCVGCRLCEVHCLVEHSASRDLIKAFKRERPRALARIRVQADGDRFLALQCRHCPDPPCVRACLTGALYRHPVTGAVYVDADKCSGCWTCMLFCPFGAISRDVARGVIAKCDLCPDRLVPACVANCPNEALIFTNGEEL